MVAMTPGELTFDTCEEISGISVVRRRALAAGPTSPADHARAAAEIDALHKIEYRKPPSPALALNGSARVAFWNLERGRHPEASAALLANAGADVNLVSELDLGMARTGQRHTTRDLADRLSQGYAFGVEFVELGLGDKSEQKQHAGEENVAGLHGAAILSGCTMTRPALCRVETDGQWFDGTHGQRRVGGRMAVAATIPISGIDVGFFSVHFDSHGDPEQRGDQMRALLAGVDAYAGEGPVIIGGDFNPFTTTIPSLIDQNWRTAALAEDPQRFVSPMSYEPLFGSAAAAGFDWHACNRPDPTRWVGRKGPVPAGMRLDWFFTRGLVAE
jgi:endonuclease/exonuclease/phosphatase family metal-dependent hydrolase